MDDKLLHIIDTETLAKLHAAGYRVVAENAPTEKMTTVLTGLLPDVYAQGSDAYYHHLWNRMMFANDTDK